MDWEDVKQVWRDTKKGLTSSIAENRKKKKSSSDFGNIGKGGKAYAEAQQELEKEYSK